MWLYPSFLCGQEIKCGTPRQVEEFFHRRSGNQIPQAYSLPPKLSDSLVSTSGKFRIHFTTTGDSASTPEYVQAVASLADEAYEFEVLSLTYPKPAYSFADSMWHIYIVDMPSTIYGYTSPIDSGFIATSPSGLPMYRSYIAIDNNFLEHPTTGLDAARITIFHEFHHVIQFAVYGFNNLEIKIHEMTSVWMEMRSSPNIFDYLLYAPKYLSTINRSFKAAGDVGYSQALWLQFLEKRFGDDIVKDIWEYYRDTNDAMITAIDKVLINNASSFCNEYKRFGAELFFTGRRYRGTSIFPDAERIPVDSLMYNVQDIDKSYVHDLLYEASLNLYAAGIGSDTCVVAVSRSPELVLSSDTVTIIDLSSYRASYQHPETFCDTIAGGTSTSAEAFPMPFVISTDKNETVKIFAKFERPSSDVRLGIYTVDMKLVRFTESEALPISGKYFMQWDGKDDVGNYVSSGVYIYSIEVDGERRIGKLVVVRK